MLRTASLRPQRDEQRVERRPAAGFEQGEDLVARRLGQFGDAIGEEQHVAVDDGVQHHAGGDAFAADQFDRIGRPARRGLALADGGQRRVGGVAQDPVEPLAARPRP